MLYILWSLLNLALILLFLYVAYRATKLLRRELGIAAALLFAIGSLSFVNGTGYREAQNHFELRKEEKKLPQNHLMQTIAIDENAAFTTYLQIKYNSKKSPAVLEPVAAQVYTGGLVLSHNLKVLDVTVVYDSTGKKWNYGVIGSQHWRLLGLKVYTQTKMFEGSAPAH